MKKVLVIYRSKLDENRGTPLRVKNILIRLVRESEINLTVASWDDRAVISAAHHIHLANNHFDDLKKLYQYIKNHDIDIVIGHTMATFYYLWPLKLLTSAKIVLEMHGFIEEEARLYGAISPFRYRVNKILYGLFYRNCDLITTCSDTAAEELSRYNKNTISIFGGVDMDVFYPDVAPKDYFMKEKGKIYIGYAGNTRAWQGLDFLVDAYRELREEYPEFMLVTLTSEAKNAPTGDGIVSVGAVPHAEVPHFLAACDILVIPRPANEVNRLSFPSKLVEYMAMGKPVVGSRTADVHKVITDGVDGILYDPGDRAGLKRCLIALKSVDSRKTLGYNAWQTTRDGYSWDKQVHTFIKELTHL